MSMMRRIGFICNAQVGAVSIGMADSAVTLAAVSDYSSASNELAHIYSYPLNENEARKVGRRWTGELG